MPDWEEFDPPRMWEVTGPHEREFVLELLWSDAWPDISKGAGGRAYGRNVSVVGEGGDSWFNVERWTFDEKQRIGLEQQLLVEGRRRVKDGDWERGKIYGEPCPPGCH